LINDSLAPRAAQAAWSLGHDWLGPEHLLIALVASHAASGAALRACGLDHDQLMCDVADLPSERYRDRSGEALSGGERKMVSIARALAHAPAGELAAAQRDFSTAKVDGTGNGSLLEVAPSGALKMSAIMETPSLTSDGVHFVVVQPGTGIETVSSAPTTSVISDT